MGSSDLYVVVAYDVVADGRRQRLRKRLKRYLTPVQESVLEGPIHPKQLATITRVVQEEIQPTVDDVRIYLLCPACAQSTILLGRARPVPQEHDPILA